MRMTSFIIQIKKWDHHLSLDLASQIGLKGSPTKVRKHIKQVQPKSAKQEMLPEDAAKLIAKLLYPLHGGLRRCVIFGYLLNKKKGKFNQLD